MNIAIISGADIAIKAADVVLALSFNGLGVLTDITGAAYSAWALLAMAVSVCVVFAISLAANEFAANPFAGRLLYR